MPKAIARKASQGTAKRILREGSSLTGKSATKQAQIKAVRSIKISKAQVKAVLLAAEKSGLLREKSSRIGGRISPALIKKAKKQTGIETDTDLIEFALANVALEDDFAKAFKKSRGKVDPALKLGF